MISLGYCLDWDYALSNWASKIPEAVARMRHVRFESDRPVGEDLVQMAIENFECIQTLEVDLIGIWSQEHDWQPQEAVELIDVIWKNVNPRTVGGGLKLIKFAGMQYDRSNWEHIMLHVERLTGILGCVESHR